MLSKKDESIVIQILAYVIKENLKDVTIFVSPDMFDKTPTEIQGFKVYSSTLIPKDQVIFRKSEGLKC